MLHDKLNDGEKRKIDDDIGNFTKDQAKAEAEAERIKAEFSAKYGEVAAGMLSSRFRAVRDLAANLVSLYEMLTDPDYTMTWETKALIIFALAYFVSPLDVIPDTIPVVGYLDDALLVGYVVHRMSDDIAKFRQWRADLGRPLHLA